MDQLKLPGGVTELEEWLHRSGGRTGRIMGVRRARWEDWSIIHRLALSNYSPFQGELHHLSRVCDGQFDLRAAADDAPVATLFANMLFCDLEDEADDVVDRFFAVVDHSLRRRSALGRRRWLAVELAVEDSDLDPEECRAALEADPRTPTLAWFDYCAVFLQGAEAALIDGGDLRPAGALH
ncbi:MAG: hypothetical protein MRY74_05325 [Neomegalonema sp.]|nr:hypothetical protein [Neomegalonema sp.]